VIAGLDEQIALHALQDDELAGSRDEMASRADWPMRSSADFQRHRDSGLPDAQERLPQSLYSARSPYLNALRFQNDIEVRLGNGIEEA